MRVRRLRISTLFALLTLSSACGSNTTANAQDSTPHPPLQDPIMPPKAPTTPNTMEPNIITEAQPQPTSDPVADPTADPSADPVAAPAADPTRSIRVTIKGFRNTKGQALVSLFASHKGFPDKGKIAQERKAYRIVGGQIKIRFDDVKPGTYAVAVLHDEDKNFKMKTGLFGIPKEGYGVSKNAKERFGPPKFTDAKFRVSAKDVHLTISMIYY